MEYRIVILRVSEDGKKMELLLDEKEGRFVEVVVKPEERAFSSGFSKGFA
jgi:hypothetical protein